MLLLTDEQSAVLGPLVEACRPPAKVPPSNLRRTVSAISLAAHKRGEVPDVLEAAHIVPTAGPLTYHVTNGLLLQADLHTLFDCGLIGIDPKTRQVVTAKALAGSTYAQFEGRKLRAPLDDGASPSTKGLQRRFALFEAAQGAKAGAEAGAA